MALRGSIGDFGLADILQLVTKTAKSGVIVLRGDTDEVRVSIRDGWIVDVETEHPSDAKLGNRLVGAGLLTDAELGQALRRRVETEERIRDILLDLDYATAESLHQYASVLATDVLFDLFTWKTGTYEFVEQAAPVGGEIEPMSIDHLLMQGIVLVDEWPVVLSRIPSHAWIVDRRWALPPERELDEAFLFSEEPSAKPGDKRSRDIGPNERLVHELAVPGNSVQSIIDRAPFSRFETSRCLSTLIGHLYLRLGEPIGS